MLTQTEARTAIQQAFATAWGVTTPVAWDNTDFNPLALSTSPWVSLTINFVTGSQIGLGGAGQRYFRSGGLIFVQVFTVAGTNAVQNDLYCQQAKNAFKGVSLAGGLWFRNERTVTVGADGKWYQQNVSVEFTFEETE